MDLATFITKSECECLNEADNHPMAHCLTSGAGYLASDCDEQLIINISFNQVNILSTFLMNINLKIKFTCIPSMEVIHFTFKRPNYNCES